MRLKATIEIKYEVNPNNYDKCGHVDVKDVVLCQEQCRLIDKVAKLNSPLIDTYSQKIKVKIEEMK